MFAVDTRCYNARAMSVSAQVADFISRTGMLKAQQTVIVGVSGGADSLCLLDCLHRLQYPLILAHLDHQLRPQSQDEAAFCRRMAERYGIPAVIEAEDVRSYADRGHSLEEAARVLRYRFLVRTAKEHGSAVIATGHTADDQVETILMHFLRGAGPSGLGGMLPSAALDDWVDVPDGKGIALVRPLLELTREQTNAHCVALGLEPIQDPSNRDPAFFRNRLRHELLPELETYNPGVRQALLRTGHVMSAVAKLQKDLVREAWPHAVTSAGDKALLLRIGPMLDLPLAIQRALIRHAVMSLDPNLRDLGFEHIARSIEFISARKTGSRQAVIGDLELLHMGDEALLWQPGSKVAFAGFPQMRTQRPRSIKVPGRVKLAQGWELVSTAGKLAAGGQKRLLAEAGENRVFLDADRLEGGLRVRTIEPGDRIQPLGMKGRIKAAELFVNEHIPQPVRPMWPMVVDERQIVWIAGIRMSHSVGLTKDSSRYVELSLVRAESET